MMEESIEVNGLRFYSYHGCMPEETAIGGEFRLDIKLGVDMLASGESDRLEDTVDYCAVQKIAEREMSIPSKLIEHVGRRIVKSLRSELKMVKSIELKLTKLSPPIGGDCKSVAVVMYG